MRTIVDDLDTVALALFAMAASLAILGLVAKSLANDCEAEIVDRFMERVKTDGK